MELMTYLATQETNTVFTSSGEGGIYSYPAQLQNLRGNCAQARGNSYSVTRI